MESIKFSIEKNDSFFDSMINLIPFELYNHTVNESQGDKIVPSKYFKHKKMPLTPLERKVLSKENKKQKFFVKESDAEASEYQDLDFSVSSENQNNSIEGLKERLQRRILDLKNQRKSNKSESKPKNKKKNQDKPNKVTQKKNKLNTTDSLNNDDNKISNIMTDLEDNFESHSGHAISEDIAYNRMLLIQESTEQGNTGSSKKNEGKVKRLQRLLTEADKKRKRIEELSTNESDPTIKKRLLGEKWNDALKAATGERVIQVSNSSNKTTSEAKIKKALKRIESKKKKSAEQWGARKESEKAGKLERIEKREKNIQSRKDKKNGICLPSELTNKKSTDKSIFKNRAGFEGKKSDGDFLNKKEYPAKRK